MWQWSACTYWNRLKMVSPVIPHMGFSKLWLTHTVYQTSVHLLKIKWKWHTWYQLLAFRFDPNREGRWEDGRGGPRGNNRTVSTLANAMPCHRTGYVKHKMHTVTKIHSERTAKENNPKQTYILKEKFQWPCSLFWIDLKHRREFHSAICPSILQKKIFNDPVLPCG